MNRILILFAHPAMHKSRVNKKLIEQVQTLENVTIHKLYEEYPDFHIDVKREQELLLEHDIYIWHHPFYWYSSPAMIKEWIDLVLQHNFAYGKKGRALEGKIAMSAITTGGQQMAYSSEGYNKYTIKQLLAPFEQTVNLCRMKYYPPFVVHGTHLLNNDGIKRYADQYQDLLTALRDEKFDNNQIYLNDYLNELIK